MRKLVVTLAFILLALSALAVAPDTALTPYADAAHAILPKAIAGAAFLLLVAILADRPKAQLARAALGGARPVASCMEKRDVVAAKDDHEDVDDGTGRDMRPAVRTIWRRRRSSRLLSKFDLGGSNRRQPVGACPQQARQLHPFYTPPVMDKRPCEWRLTADLANQRVEVWSISGRNRDLSYWLTPL